MEIKQDSILKDIAIGAAVIIAVAIIISIARDRLYVAAKEGEYLSDTLYVNMEYNLKNVAVDGKQLVKVLRSYDTFSDKLEDDEMYADFIIYGDDVYTNANDFDYKVAFANNIVGNLNWYKEDINSLLKELKGDNKREVKYLLKKLRKDIQETNYWIQEYNEAEEISYSLVYSLTEEIK